MMKLILTTFLYSTMAFGVSNVQSISGNVESNPKCSKKAMVWLSLDKDSYKERLLLMHTEVPVGGTFNFYVRPGDYQIRGSDEAGCEFLKKVSITGNDYNLIIKMVKK